MTPRVRALARSPHPPPPPPQKKLFSSNLHDSRRSPVLASKRRISPKGEWFSCMLFIISVRYRDQSAAGQHIYMSTLHSNLANDDIIECWPGGPVAAGRRGTCGGRPGGGAVLLVPLLSHADGAPTERCPCPLKKRCSLVRIQSMPYIHTHLTRPESYACHISVTASSILFHIFLFPGQMLNKYMNKKSRCLSVCLYAFMQLHTCTFMNACLCAQLNKCMHVCYKSRLALMVFVWSCCRGSCPAHLFVHVLFTSRGKNTMQLPLPPSRWQSSGSEQGNTVTENVIKSAGGLPGKYPGHPISGARRL